MRRTHARRTHAQPPPPTHTHTRAHAQMSIGKQLKQVLDLDSANRIGFLAHSDAMAMDRKAKDRYTI